DDRRIDAGDHERIKDGRIGGRHPSLPDTGRGAAKDRRRLQPRPTHARIAKNLPEMVRVAQKIRLKTVAQTLLFALRFPRWNLPPLRFVRQNISVFNRMYRSAIGVCGKDPINRTRMTRIERIDADLFGFIRDDPRSINPYTDLETALGC